jgi:nucleoside diphosphate kinase
MTTALAQHLKDTRQFWLENGSLQWAASPSGVPDEVWDDACTIYEAISFVQHLGCAGRSQHQIKTKYHETCLAVLRMAVQEYGEVFPVLLRGTRSARPDSEHRILFGTTNPDVASFYGEIRQYYNVRGLRTSSLVLSVVTDDYSQADEEIIFFPQ